MGWIIGGSIVVFILITLFSILKVASNVDDQLLGDRQYEE